MNSTTRSLSTLRDSTLADGILPDAVQIVVGSITLEVPKAANDREHIWYTFLSANGKPLRGGVAIQTLDSSLPDSILIDGIEIACQPVAKFDKQRGVYLDEYEDFSVKRIAEAEISDGTRTWTARIRIAQRKDDRLNVAARIWPDQPITDPSKAGTGSGAKPERPEPRVPDNAAERLATARRRLYERFGSANQTL